MKEQAQIYGQIKFTGLAFIELYSFIHLFTCLYAVLYKVVVTFCTRFRVFRLLSNVLTQVFEYFFLNYPMNKVATNLEPARISAGVSKLWIFETRLDPLRRGLKL